MKNKIIAAGGVFTVGFVIGLTVVYTLLSGAGDAREPTPSTTLEEEPIDSATNANNAASNETKNQAPRIVEKKKATPRKPAPKTAGPSELDAMPKKTGADSVKAVAGPPPETANDDSDANLDRPALPKWWIGLKG